MSELAEGLERECEVVGTVSVVIDGHSEKLTSRQMQNVRLSNLLLEPFPGDKWTWTSCRMLFKYF